MIQVQTINGTDYFTTEARGVEYAARVNVLGLWEVSSRRKSLGRRNVGTCRHFDSIEQMAASISAFRGLDRLVAGA